jgi:hypothetical protein
MMPTTSRTIEILLQLKQTGAEAVKQLAGTLTDLANPVNQVRNAFAGAATVAQQSANRINLGLRSIRSELKSGELAVKVFSAGASAGLHGIEVAAEAVWSALTFGISGVVKIVTTALSFLNPLSLRGLATGAAFGGVGLVAKEWLDAADGAETYRKRLGVLINDQAIANRIFDDFEHLSQRSGIEAEQLSATFSRLYDLRVADAQKATTTLAGVAALMQTDIGELTDILSNPNARGLSRFGINLDTLGNQVRIASGGITKVVDNTEQAVRQGLIDLFAEKFPNALQLAQQSFSTQMAIVRVNLGQFAQDFGGILLPAATGTLQKINDFLIANRDQIVSTIKAIPEIAASARDQVVALLDSGKIASTLAPLAGPLTTLFDNLIANLLRILVAGLKLGAVPFVAVWRVLLAELQTAWQIFTDNLIPTLINSIKHGVTSVAASPALQTLLNAAVPGAGKAVVEAAGSVPDLSTRPLDSSSADFLKKVDAALDKSVKDGKAAIGDLRAAFSDLFGYLKTDSQGVGAVFTSIFGPQIKTAVDTVTASVAKAKALATQNRSSASPALPLDQANPETLFQISQLGLSQFDQRIAQARKEAADELATLKGQLVGRENAEQLGAQAELGIRQNLANQIKDIENEKAVAAQQAVVAITSGYQQMVAQNQLAYQQDLANWEKRLHAGEITPAQFNELQEKLAGDLSEKLRQADVKIQQAGDQVQLQILNAQHQASAAKLKQIDIDTAAQAEALRQQYRDGLVSAEQYDAAIVALEKSTAEKRKEINGSFFDGLTLGFQKVVDAQLTMGQVGGQVAGDITGGLGDAFTSIITGSKSAADAFRGFAVSLLADIAKLIIEFEILQIVKAALGFFGSASGVGGNLSGVAGGVHGVNTGGLIAGYAVGGMVGTPSGPDRDSVLAGLTLGEFVVRRQAVQQPGVLPLLHAINSGSLRQRIPVPAGGMAAAATGGAGGVQIVPALVANDSQMRTLLEGGATAMLDFLRTNASRVKGAIGVRP